MNTGSTFEQNQLEKILVGVFNPKEKKAPIPLRRARPKVVVLAGPTASGKTEMGLFLSNALRGEIISADSMQIYRGMDIGTAKATPQQQALVPHHLIDIRSVRESFNVVDFYHEARHYCEKLSSHNVVPIVVGGSGFYIHTLLYGPPNGPPSIPEVRKALEEEANRLGIDKLYERLVALDKNYAESITPHDRQKIIRALEIITLSGNSVSVLPWKERNMYSGYDFRCWFIHRSRENLYHRIEKRCDEMIEKGLLKEIASLEENGLKENLSASQSIGYRQGLEYLQTNRKEEDYDEFIRNFKQASKRYVKRQFTWFRRESQFRWLDLELHDLETAVDIIIQDYKRN